MLVNTSQAKGFILDFLVATAQGFKTGQYEGYEDSVCVQMPYGSIKFIKGGNIMDILRHGYWRPTTDPAQAWPIIDEERITVGPHTTSPFIAHYGPADPIVHWEHRFVGPTGLVAAMRAYVAKKLGEEFDVPEELC